MNDVERALAQLSERVAALEVENTRLRAEHCGPTQVTRRMTTYSRRGLLVGSAGMIGAMAAVVTQMPSVAGAAPVSTEGAVMATRYREPHLLGTRVRLTPQHGGGAYSARYLWDMDGTFAGDEPPAVVACAADDYHGSSERAEPTVAVVLRRSDSAWQAEIVVSHVGHLATEVTVNVIAFGSRS